MHASGCSCIVGSTVKWASRHRGASAAKIWVGISITFDGIPLPYTPPGKCDEDYNWRKDIGIERIAGMARFHQPGLIVVDRTVAGRLENYAAPEV